MSCKKHVDSIQYVLICGLQGLKNSISINIYICFRKVVTQNLNLFILVTLIDLE